MKIMGSEDTTAPLPKALVDWEERLSKLEAKFEQRGYNTRPMYEVHEERIAKLEKQLGELRLQIRTDLSFRDGAYWAQDDETPFCAPCFETKGKRVHLTAFSSTRKICPNCQQKVGPRLGPSVA